MPTILPRLRQFGCVIEAESNDGATLPLSPEEFEDALEKNASADGFRYWGILHDCDKEPDGTMKRPHYHLVLEFPTKHTTTGVVSYLSSIFVVSQNRVSVRQVKAFNMALRYLTHCDDGDKTPYPPNEVYTNDISALTYAYAQQNDEMDIETLCTAVEEARGNYLLIMKRIGLKQYNRYRNAIRDICLSLNYK